MTVLVTGARGVLGRRVVTQLVERGHMVRTAGRTDADVTMDLADGTGLSAAVDGIEAVLHCATSPLRHRKVDRDGTARLLAAAQVPIIYAGIVGSDVIPLPYYKSRITAEAAILTHRPGGTVVRATQFHQLIWASMERLAKLPVVPLPNGTRFQVLDPTVVARRMVEAFEARERGRLPDVGGPNAYGTKELAKSYLTATGRHRRVASINLPGIVGAAFRAGANLTENRDDTGETWNDFVRRESGR